MKKLTSRTLICLILALMLAVGTASLWYVGLRRAALGSASRQTIIYIAMVFETRNDTRSKWCSFSASHREWLGIP